MLDLTAVSRHSFAILVTIGFSAVGVLGDYFLKLASQQVTPLRSMWFYVGFAVYASTAFGWVFVMRHLKLATVGVVYSVSMIVLLTAIGAFVFGESLGPREVTGLILAIASLCLLMRFA
jgi:drug/metabolite transporter (DMT)-like permease